MSADSYSDTRLPRIIDWASRAILAVGTGLLAWGVTMRERL